MSALRSLSGVKRTSIFGLGRYPIENSIHSPSLRSDERPSGDVRIFNPQKPAMTNVTVNVCGNGGVLHSALYGEAHPEDVRVTASGYIGSEEPLCRGRDRQCGEPL